MAADGLRIAQPVGERVSMRRAARVDDNQGEIVAALRKAGCLVQSLAAIGSGCPDLIVGYRAALILMELKDGSKPPSARTLTPDQVKWHATAKEHDIHVHVIESVEAALAVIEQFKRG